MILGVGQRGLTRGGLSTMVHTVGGGMLVRGCRSGGDESLHGRRRGQCSGEA
jgi:hypothetical protein